MAEWLNGLRLRLRSLLRRAALERDLHDEMAFHLAMREEQLHQSGAADAGTTARRRFGSTTRIREELRDAWAVAPRLSSVVHDVRYAARALLRHRGFAAVVVLTLALAIAINTATFSIVNAVLFQPLGFPEEERLVALGEGERLGGANFALSLFSPPDYLDVEREQQSFEGVAVWVPVSLELSGTGEAARIVGTRASPALFRVLGVSPLLGRTFTAEEDRPGADVAVVSWGLWQTRYGGDRSILGRTIVLERRPHTVIGVMPAGFEFPGRRIVTGGPARGAADVWVPMAFTDGLRQARGANFNYSAVARLKPGVSLEQASAELDAIAARITERYPPAPRDMRASIALSAVPLREQVAGQFERPLLLLLAAVGLVLLVGCANVANLVLSRAASRSRELAVRAALGSSRVRLAQLLLAEATVLSLAGAVLGVLGSRLIVWALPAAVAERLPTSGEIPVDGRVLAFAAGLTILTTILFALLPLVGMDCHREAGVLQEEASRTTTGARSHRVQAGLVVSTVALACVLLVGAGLFIRSFSALIGEDAGFDPDRVLTASMTLPRAGYSTAASVRAFHRELFSRGASLPGVRSAALTTDVPLERYERRRLSAQGVPSPGGRPPSTNLSWVYGPYFETLDISLTRGRPFEEVESIEPRFVVIVNERLARTFWPGQDPLGKRIRWGINVPDTPQNPNPWLTVVGVAADVANSPPGTEPYLHAWEPFSQFPDRALDNMPTSFGRQVKLALRTDADPRALVSRVRAEIAEIDGQLAIQSIETMDERIDEATAARRFSVITLAAFAAGALLLAAVGVYGLLAFSVAERRREIAVRLAIGAEPRAIVGMVIGRGLTLVAIGLAAGVIVSLAAARAVTSLLYRTDGHDSLTFGVVAVVLMAVALAACAIPAYRASRVEPLAALRVE
jgi:predicted permease